MIKRSVRMLGLALACAAPTVHALGLGELRVDSFLNQPLAATIEIQSATPAELEALRVRVAPPQVYERLGLLRDDALLGLQFRVVRDGTPRILVTSREPVREPFLSLVVDAEWGSGRLQREYTILLDPPGYESPKPTAPEPAPPAVATAPAAQESRQGTVKGNARSGAPAPAALPQRPRSGPALPTPRPPVPQQLPEPRGVAEPAAGTRRYGPVKPQETLWSIADRLRPDPDAVTVPQMAVALYEANPHAFSGGLNTLQRGAVLRVPTLDEILAVDPDKARARVREQGAPAAPPARAPAAAGQPAPAVAMAPQPEPVAPPGPAPEPAAMAEPEAPVEPEPVPVPGLEEDTAAEAPQEAPATDEAQQAAAAPAPAIEPPAAASGSALAHLQRLRQREREPLEEDSAAAPAGTESEDLAEAAPGGGDAAQARTITETGADRTGPSFEEPEVVDAQLPVEGEPAGAEAAGEGAAADAGPVPARPSLPPAPEQADEGLPWGLIGGALAAVLLLGGGLFAWRRRSASAPAVAGPQSAPQASAAGTQPLEDVAAVAVEDTQSLDEAAEEAADDATPEAVADATHPAMEVADLDAAQQPADAPKDAAATAEPVDFDVTAQFASETVQIDLKEGDPISEADFHIAYGLYDEAALILQTALEKEPARKDLKLKLLDTWFTAGKAQEFTELAAELKGELDAAEWQKVVIMGAQIAPDHPLFASGGEGEADAGLTPDIDLDIGAQAGQPQGEAAAPDLVLDEEPAAQPDGGSREEEPAEAPATGDDVLEFDLGDFDLGDEEAASETAEGADASRRREQDAGAEAGEAAAEAAPSEAQVAPADDDALLDLDLTLDDSDLPLPGERDAAPDAATGRGTGDDQADTPPDAPAESAEQAAEVDDLDLDFDLQLDEEPSEQATETETISAGDEVATNLDLARAYIDMGDVEMARKLLDDVLSRGDEAQQAEARELMERLD